MNTINASFRIALLPLVVAAVWGCAKNDSERIHPPHPDTSHVVAKPEKPRTSCPGAPGEDLTLSIVTVQAADIEREDPPPTQLLRTPQELQAAISTWTASQGQDFASDPGFSLDLKSHPVLMVPWQTRGHEHVYQFAAQTDHAIVVGLRTDHDCRQGGMIQVVHFIKLRSDPGDLPVEVQGCALQAECPQ